VSLTLGSIATSSHANAVSAFESTCQSSTCSLLTARLTLECSVAQQPDPHVHAGANAVSGFQVSCPILNKPPSTPPVAYIVQSLSSSACMRVQGLALFQDFM
jgi:Tfp pilus assembly protein PilX